MMKKIFALLVCLVLLLGAIPYYLGGQAEQTLTAQHQVLSEKFYVDVLSRQYQRGWFSSTETITIRLHPEVLAKVQDKLPDNIKNLLSQPITIIHHIKHGLFADGIKPVRAVVESEFQYEKEVGKTLTRFFGEATPITMRHVIALNGSGDIQMAFGDLDYEELSGITINWHDMKAVFHHQDEEFTQTKWQFDAPNIDLKLANKGSLNIQGLSLNSGLNQQENDYFSAGLKQFEVRWQEEIPYDIRLNDLLNLITDLQIGAFINPNGNIAPNHIVLQNLRYRADTQNTAQFLDTKGLFAFEKLQYGETLYGPLNIDFSLNHINAPSLAALKQRWQAIAKEPLSSEEAKQKILDAIRQEGAGIFTSNPVFTLNQFEFHTPNGAIQSKGQLAFKDLQANDLNQLSNMVRKTQADFYFKVAKNLLETFALNQARGLFTLENPNSQAEQAEIDETIKWLIEDTINSMKNQGFLTIENDEIQTHLVLDNNTMTLNNHIFERQEDEFDAIESQIDQDAASMSEASSVQTAP